MVPYTSNYPHWARGSFPRFAIPILPFIYLALERWLPKDKRFLWALGIVTSFLAPASALGIRNVRGLLQHAIGLRSQDFAKVRLRLREAADEVELDGQDGFFGRIGMVRAALLAKFVQEQFRRQRGLLVEQIQKRVFDIRYV